MKDSIRWYLGTSVQIEDIWVRAEQNRIGIVRHGDSSEDIGSQRSKVENHGEEEKNQKLRYETLDARHGTIESGAVVKSRKGLLSVEGGKGICYQWKEKKPMFQGRPVQFPAWEWWSCTKTDTDSRSTHWATNDTRLTNNRTKSRKRAIIPQKEEKAMTRVLQLLCKLYHSWFVSRKTQSHQNFRKAWRIGETRGGQFWDQFDGYDSRSLRYVMRVFEKIKDHRLDKYKSKFLISEVPTLSTLGTDPRKRLKDSSDAPDENNEGFLEKTCWYSRAQSGTCWWLDNYRSQNPQWRMWISTQSSIRCVVVQDLATQWLESCRCETKTSQETQKNQCVESRKGHLRCCRSHM